MLVSQSKVVAHHQMHMAGRLMTKLVWGCMCHSVIGTVALVVGAFLPPLQLGAQTEIRGPQICGQHEVRYGADLTVFPNIGNVQLSGDVQQNMLRLPYVVLLNALLSLGSDLIAKFFDTYGLVLGTADDFVAPASDEFGMTKSTHVYLSIPKAGTHDAFKEKLTGADKEEVKGHLLFSWRDTSFGAIANYFATRFADGEVLLSNSRSAIVKALMELELKNARACPESVSGLSKQPYWIYRENRSRNPVPVDDPLFGRNLEWLSLSVAKDRRTYVEFPWRLCSRASTAKNATVSDFLVKQV